MSETAVATKLVDSVESVAVVDSPSNLNADLHPVVIQQKVVAAKSLEIQRNWQTTLQPKMLYQMAKLAVAYGLDPFLGELVCLGDKPYPTVAALQRKANENPTFDGEECRPATAEERIAFYLPAEPPPDEYLWRCEVWVKGKAHSFVGWGRASKANVKMSTMQMWLPEMAQKRARGRTYRLAFNIGIPTVEEMYVFEDGSVMEADASMRVEQATGPVGASKEQYDMINEHVLVQEKLDAGLILESEWNGIVAAWDTMNTVRAESILQHFLGPTLDGKGGIFEQRSSQKQ